MVDTWSHACTVYLQIFLILIVTFELSSHQWSLYKSTNSIIPNYIKKCKEFFFRFWNNWFRKELVCLVFGSWLDTVNNFYTLLFLCFHLLWFGLWYFLQFWSDVMVLGLAMMSFIFLSSYLDIHLHTYTIVDWCNLLPLMLMNYILLLKFNLWKMELEMSILLVHTLNMEHVYNCHIDTDKVPIMT